jgi:DNA-binding transcriptional ArsR family regulator
MLNYAYQDRLPKIGDLLPQLLGQMAGESRQRGGRHLTKQAVHGGSKEAGSFQEEAFYAKLDDTMRRACRRGVKEMFERGRRAAVQARREGRELTAFERLCVAITNSAIRVYEALLRMEKRFKGRVFPSYELIAEWATVSRSTVYRALDALEAAGLLARLRRYVQTKDKTIGARSEQTSNAYRMQLPAIVRDLIERRFRPAPMPADEAQRQHQRLADHAAMLGSLSRGDYIRATTGDAALAAVLIRLGESVELANRSVS